MPPARASRSRALASDGPAVESTVVLEPFDIHATMGHQLLGRFDPTGRRGTDSFEKVHLDGEGRPLTWRFVGERAGFSVRVSGEGARPALEKFLAQFPLSDGAGGDLLPEHPVVSRLARACAGMRLLRVPWPFDVAAGAVLQQRVRWQVGCNDFRRVARRWGTPTETGIAFPSAKDLAKVSTATLESAGIDMKRARALNGLARLEANRPFLGRERDPERLRMRLRRIPGIGPWTANMIAGYASGDPDAVPVGDLHLPSVVTSALAGEPEGTDERMLELLEPWRGQRFRVVRLLAWSARLGAGGGDRLR